MERMDVAKDAAVKMTGEDLAHAYDAVRVANKSVCLCIYSQLIVDLFSCHFDMIYVMTLPFSFFFPAVYIRFLESQLRDLRSRQEEELDALRSQLALAISGSSSAAHPQVWTD